MKSYIEAYISSKACDGQAPATPEDIVDIEIKAGGKATAINNADEKLRSFCTAGLAEKYGNNVSGFISERYESEINSIILKGLSSDYLRAYMIAEKCLELGCLYDLGVCAGGSFVLYLMGISELNPLPPHYYCRKCKRVEFVDAEEYPSGFDLNTCDTARKICPCCGDPLVGDGHNVPFESFAEDNGSKITELKFNFSSDCAYRDSYYFNDGGEDAELILAKNHRGSTGTAYVDFNRELSVFESR